MVHCYYCGDENVTPLSSTFAEMRGNKPIVYRWYRCRICKLEFKEIMVDETERYNKARLDNQGRDG